MLLPEVLFLPLPAEHQTGFHRQEVSRSSLPKTHTERKRERNCESIKNKRVYKCCLNTKIIDLMVIERLQGFSNHLFCIETSFSHR